MIKFICRAAKPAHHLFSYLFHSNPRRLLDITVEAKRATEENILILAEEFSEILHDVRVGGVWKRTSPGRLPLTTEALIKNLPDNNKAGIILDIGSSDGCTSADLVHALRENCERKFQVHMADLYLWLDVWRKGAWSEYRSTQGLPVMVELGWFGMRLPQSEHRWDIFGSLLAKLYLSFSAFRKSFAHEVRIPMINPLALTLGEDCVLPIEMDCLQSNSAPESYFDAIRASNILNLGYFSPEQLNTILGHFHGYLRKDGILIVSRNEGSVSNETESGTVWQRTEDGFDCKDSFGQGSEIDVLVETYNAASKCESQ